jgi:hypothetical protein
MRTLFLTVATLIMLPLSILGQNTHEIRQDESGTVIFKTDTYKRYLDTGGVKRTLIIIQDFDDNELYTFSSVLSKNEAFSTTLDIRHNAQYAVAIYYDDSEGVSYNVSYVIRVLKHEIPSIESVSIEFQKLK